MLLFSDPNADLNGSGQRKASDGTGEDIPYCLGSFELGVGGDVGVGVQREARRVVSEHRGHRFYIHAVLKRAAASRRAGRGFRPPVPLHSPADVPADLCYPQQAQHAVQRFRW